MIVRMRGMGGCGCGCDGTPGGCGGMGQTPADIWTGAQAILTPAAWPGVIQSGNWMTILGLVGVPVLGLLLLSNLGGRR